MREGDARVGASYVVKFEIATDGTALWWCPGCETHHGVPVRGTEKPGRPVWGYNGDQTSPTLTPSVLIRTPLAAGEHLCHCFVRDGKIEFLGDCTHALRGQTVEIPEWDDAREEPPHAAP